MKTPKERLGAHLGGTVQPGTVQPVSAQPSKASRWARMREKTQRLSWKIAAMTAMTVVVLTIGVVVATTLSGRAAMIHQIDQQLARMVNRHITLDELRAKAGVTEPLTDIEIAAELQREAHHDDGSGDVKKHGKSDGKISFAGKNDKEKDGHRFENRPLPGRQPGVLEAVVNGDQSAAMLYSEFDARPLAQNLINMVKTVAVGKPPQTVSLGKLGDYRIIARNQDGATVYFGLTLRNVAEATGIVVWWTALAGVIAAVVALTLVLLVVRRAVRPLSDVAAVASAMAQADLVRDSGMSVPRVPAPTVRTPLEIAQVGNSLNVMLERVTQALRERSATEDKLRQFVADASHELRTPLAAVKGYAQLGQRDGEPLEALRSIESQATHMSVLVEDLLALARMDAERTDATALVDVRAGALQALTDAVVAWPEHDWSFGNTCADTDSDSASSDSAASSQNYIDDSCEVETTPLLVRIPEHYFSRIMQNLVGNAAKHTPSGSSVAVYVDEVFVTAGDVEQVAERGAVPDGGAGDMPGASTVSSAGAGSGSDASAGSRACAGANFNSTTGLVCGAYARIVVADNGCGVPQELRERIFDRFVCGDTARTGSSSGLGLALAREMARAVGGDVRLEESDQGATFAVYLPKADN